MKVRLQKLLADAGLGSRRSCEDLIKGGRVQVDGAAASLGMSVDPETETVTVDGLPIEAQPKEYWVLNKPAGVLSAVIDDRGRRTVTDCVPTQTRIFPVGRLDFNTTGVLLLTNDGELAERLLHPRYHVDKEYVAEVEGSLSEGSLRQLREGLCLDDGDTSPALVTLEGETTVARPSRSKIRLIIREGRKRQVRRMLAAVGHEVRSLHRTRFASVTDGGLALGQARRLAPSELATLREMAGLL